MCALTNPTEASRRRGRILNYGRHMRQRRNGITLGAVLSVLVLAAIILAVVALVALVAVRGVHG
jgi:hypothetical protein